MSPGDSFTSWVARKRTERRFGIDSSDDVLEIGSGHNPYRRSDVLSDRYIESDEERGGAISRDDRPLLQADVGSLPFVDNGFDFVIASHVIEHVDIPDAALREIGRVGERGYIECPTLFWELLRPSREYHKWVVLPIDGELVFYPKSEIELPPFGTIFERGGLPTDSRFLSMFFDQYQSLFLVQHCWEGEIEFVVTPEDDDLRQFFEGPYDMEMVEHVLPTSPRSHSSIIARTVAKRTLATVLGR